MFGLPVVATRWRGIPDVVADGETGLLVEPGDEAALADGLGRLLNDPELRARLGAAGRAGFEQRFTAARYAERMCEVFRELAATP